MKLSPHFTEDECRCPCCKRLHIDYELPVVMELVRELNGDKPITPNSVFRCAKHNAEVGGAKESYHLQGMAADMPVDNPRYIFSKLDVMFPDVYGLIIYDTFIHVDVRKTRYRGDRRSAR